MKKTFKLAALFSIALISACSGEKKTNNKTNVVEEENPKVKVQSVSSRDIEQIREYTATVEAEVTNNIAPATPVRIDKIFVEVGDRVAKGQRLVTMDAANLKQLKLQLDNQQAEFNRIDELYKVGGVSKSEWEAVKMALDVRETSYKNLLENTALISPISGVVTARNYDNGDMYSGAKPVLVVEQDQPVKMLINVSEEYYPLIKKGQKVDVKLDTYGDETFAGTVTIVYPAVNATTHTFPVEVRVANADRRVRPGMFARVTITFGTENNVLVPDQAVVKQIGSGDYYVYVLNSDNTVSYNKVELGRRFEGEYEIKSGVESGASVVVAGQNNLANGKKVDVIK